MGSSLLFFATLLLQIILSFSLQSRTLSINTEAEKINAVNTDEKNNLQLAPAEWELLWLSGALIAFLTYFEVDEIKPKWNKEEQFVMNQLQPALINDGVKSSKPLIRLGEEPVAIKVARDTYTYAKGSSIIRMMNLTFGVSIFETGLKNYLKLQTYETATPDNLWSSFQKQVDDSFMKLPADIKTIMDSWTRQAGFPVLSVEVKQGMAKLHQQRYLVDTLDPTLTNTTWWIPLTWTSESNLDFTNTTPKYWLYKTEDEIELKTRDDEWVIFNVQQAGFYRVNYDRITWHRIIYTLNFNSLNRIPTINRAVIINDLFNLAKAGILPFEVALNSLIYISRETDYLPIEAALTEMEFLQKLFAGRWHDLILNEFFLALIIPIYNRLGFYDRPKDDNLTNLLREKITYWTCNLGHAKCNNIALQYFFNWKNSSTFTFPMNRAVLIFCTAIKYDTSGDPNGAVELITDFYKKSVSLTVRAIMINSLSCIQNATILKNTLESALDNGKRDFIWKQEIIFMFKIIAKHNYKNSKLILDFIIEHYDKMLKYYGDHKIFGEIISTLSEMLTTEDDVKKLLFFNKTKNIIPKSFLNSFEAAIKKITNKFEFYEKYYEDIVSWIEHNNFFVLLDAKKKLKSKNDIKIEIIERAFVLFYTFYSAEALLPDDISALVDLQHLIQKMSYFLWKKIFKDFAYLRSKITEENSSGILELHMLAILKPIYDKLGFKEKKNDSHEDKLLRIDVIYWACTLNHADCIINSLQLFKDWKSNLHKSVSSNLQRIIFCTVMKWGSIEDTHFLLDKYLRTEDWNEKLTIEYALGCTEDYNTMEIISLVMLNKFKVHLHDSLKIISSICFSNPNRVNEILNFMCNREEDEIPIEYKNANELKRFFKEISFCLSTKQQLEQFQSCMTFYGSKIPTIAISLQSYAHQAYNELEQFNNYSIDFIRWLKTTYSSYNYRLPNNIKPIKYKIALAPHLDYFYGSVKMILNVLDDIFSIVMHANELFINKIEVYSTDTRTPIDVLFFILNRDHRLEIFLDTIVEAGSQITVLIMYGGILNDEAKGFYRSYYKDDDGNDHWLLTTQFQKFDARRAFPCFDEPALKAKFVISILRPNDYTTLSNMNWKYSTPSKQKINWTWDHYEESILMSTYLVAFIVCDYKLTINLNNNLRFWSYRNITQYELMSLDVVEKSLEFLKAYTEITPMVKIDFIEIPNFYLFGMENWGLIVLSDGLIPLAFDHSLSHVLYSIAFREFVIVHEIAHTWFGNLVTCETWEYLWLNEGFTRYFEWIIMDSLEPNIRWMEKFTGYLQQMAMQLDSLITALPMNNKKMNLIADNNKYDNSGLIHIKSASIVRMMQHAFGDEILHKALKYYLKQNQYSTSTPSDLWSAMEIMVQEAGGLPGVGQSVAMLMESWTSQPGYPVVHVSRTCSNLTLVQERFLITGRNESLKELYWIPITIATESNPDFSNTSPTLWMGSKEMVITVPNIKDGWTILNVQQTGFYRVNYDLDSWKNLFRALNQDDFGGIPEVNRAQIIDDLFNLARADYISYDLALTGSLYILHERGHLPWKAFFRSIDVLYKKFDSMIITIHLKHYLTALMSPFYYELQFEERPEDIQLDQMNRALILSWAHKLDFSHCVIRSILFFYKWYTNSVDKSVSLDENTIIFCTALRHSDYHERNFVWNQYLKANTSSERLFMLRILGCSKNTTAIVEYLHIAVFQRSLISEDDVKTVLSSIFSSRRYAVDASLDFLLQHHNDISKISDGWTLIDPLFTRIGREALTSTLILKLHNFVQIMNGTHISEKLERIFSNALKKKIWYDKRVDVFERWLITRKSFWQPHLTNIN